MSQEVKSKPHYSHYFCDCKPLVSILTLILQGQERNTLIFILIVMVHQAKYSNKILSEVIVRVTFQVQLHSSILRLLFQAAIFSTKNTSQILRDCDIHSCPVGVAQSYYNQWLLDFIIVHLYILLCWIPPNHFFFCTCFNHWGFLCFNTNAFSIWKAVKNLVLCFFTDLFP